MKTNLSTFMAATLILASTLPLDSAELHVSVNGDDTNSGTQKQPFRTIQRAAHLAQPGDTVIVHEGVYRERVNPPRGGESDQRRIVYRAAPGEKVEIKGSEQIKKWIKVKGDVWKATLPNALFGGFNPYTNEIRGDWFDPRGRKHHTGAVYLNGEWLTEAASLDEVMLPDGAKPAWITGGKGPYLINVAWFRPGGEKGSKIEAAKFSVNDGVQVAPCSEGGECIGFIEHDDSVRYENLNLGEKTREIEFRAASVSEVGIIEVRLDGPDGELLGTCQVKPTGDWQQWASFTANIKPISGTKNICLVFKAPKPPLDRGLNRNLWFAQVDDQNTTIWAQFGSADPNAELVEINARQSVFYPDQPGRNFITVRGFTMRHAATPWAPPTAEQIGLIGVHWSKGWIIEDNVISHSVCTGITLGKHGDRFDNTSANTAEGYVKTIERAHAFPIPWTKDQVGGHIVQNNTISHCEQAGIVGSMGAAFCTVSDNTIHDIHIRRLFSGAEMAGIKFHGAIDTTIRRNHIYRCCQAIWLDWMAQGARVTANLFHDNEDRDLFMEVDHGPYLIDNNFFLSRAALLDMSQGGAFVHNLVAGKLVSVPELGRETPYHPPHSTVVAGLSKIEGGENRFYNNVFIGDGTDPALRNGSTKDPKWGGAHGLWQYDFRPHPLQAAGNVYYFGAQPSVKEVGALVLDAHDPGIQLVQKEKEVSLHLNFPKKEAQEGGPIVTTELLGKARIPQAAFENPDGTPVKIDTDYFGKKRSGSKASAGPLAERKAGTVKLALQPSK